MTPTKPVSNSTGNSSPWDTTVPEYSRTWLTLNRPMILEAIDRLPTLPDGAHLHIPGIGPGLELPLLSKKYPGRRFIASDESPLMLERARETTQDLKKQNVSIEFVEADIHRPPVASLDASISFFVVHLAWPPFEAVTRQWASLAPGGWLAAQYFPPTPLGEGPLAALHRASHRLNPRPDSTWEPDAIHFLREQGAVDLVRESIFTTWRFSDVSDFRQTMEILPHIAAIRSRAGDAAYERLWDYYFEDPGLTRDGHGWRGDAGSILLLARKSQLE